MQFKNGDLVKHTSVDLTGKVLYGPFTPAQDYILEDVYLVELQDGVKKGKATIWSSDRVKALPKFAPGQAVRFSYSLPDEWYEVVAGPYPTSVRNTVFWVIKDREGVHDTAFEEHMTPVVQ